MLASIASLLLRNVMVVLMLSVGLQTTLATVRTTWASRALVGRALAVLLIGVPVLAILTVTVLPLRPQVAAFVALMAVCPGAPVVFRSFRDRPLLVTIIAAVSILAPLAVWLGAELIDRVYHLGLDASASTLVAVALKQLVPLAIGIAVASAWPRVAAKLAVVAWYAFIVAFLLAVVLVLVKGAPGLLQFDGWMFAAVIVMVIGSAAMGYSAGLPDRGNGRLLGTIAVLGNPALAIAVITSSYPGFRPGALFAGYLIARGVALVPFTLWSKRHARRPPTRFSFGSRGATPATASPGR